MLGRFITFEGIDGCGKSTQIQLLAQKLAHMGQDALTIRDPGTTRISERIRAILLDRELGEMAATTELLLYESARSQMVKELIEPALNGNRIVICDRFYDSTTAYQGYGRQLDLGMVALANQLGSCGIKPNLTFLLDMEPELALQRKHHDLKKNDRLENETIDFYRRVRRGYLILASQNPDIIQVIDGKDSKEKIEMTIWSIIEKHLQTQRES